MSSKSNGIALGPLTGDLMSCAEWAGEDAFPSTQGWADYIETTLEVLRAHGLFELYKRKMAKQVRQRRSALAEAFIVRMLAENGFTVLEWEPSIATSRTPDLLARAPDGTLLYIEIKGTGWEGQLSEVERAAGRSRLPKDIQGEARSFSTIEPVYNAIQKAAPQLPQDQVSLIAIVDDLFESPVEFPDDVLNPAIERFFQDPSYGHVSAVLFGVVTQYVGLPPRLYTRLIPNRSCNPASRLPADAMTALSITPIGESI